MDERVDAALADLGATIAFPPTPDLRPAVAAAVGATAPRRTWSWPLRRALALAVLGTLLVAGTVAALVIALPGLRISFVPDVPTDDARPGPLAERLSLGAPLDPDSVAVGIPALLGTPDEAYVFGDDEVVSLVYAASESLPDLRESGIGLIVQRIDGTLDDAAVEKLVPEVGAEVTAVDVAGADGYWISGPPHVVRYLAADGDARTQATRLVGDTLVWQRGDTLYRIESGLGRDATLRIAESIPP